MRVRTVSEDVARLNAVSQPWFDARLRYSSVPSQIEPVHTPCAPSARDAATCRPEPMPPAPGRRGPSARPARADAPGAEDGHAGADRVDDVGGEDHRGHLTGVAAGL